MPKLAWSADPTLRHINWALFVAICCINLYIVATPFLPKAVHTVSNIVNKPLDTTKPDNPDVLATIDRNKNQLYIPGIKLTQPIYEGTNPKTVNRGVWRLPQTSTPEHQSNTVLVGHRFSYKNPSVFYFLDKVKQDDAIYVSWNKKIYIYKVSDIQIVTPDTTNVEDPTEDPQLTIYTCTPLWSTSHRLVIRAKLAEVL